MIAIVGDADAPDGTVSADPRLDALAAPSAPGFPRGRAGRFPSGPPVASVPEQDEAVRHAIRRIVEAGKGGTSWTGSSWSTRPQTHDARLVQERLSTGGITFHASGVRRLDETVVDDSWSASWAADRNLREVTSWPGWAHVPLWDPDHDLVPARAWTRLALRAGVGGGLDDWTNRLSRLATELEDEAAEEADEEARPWLVERLASEAEMARTPRVRREARSVADGVSRRRLWSGRCRRSRPGA
ncbi:MAG: hypothetical protein Ct9H300mP31_16510 [Acidimicrobiaceae bacterium]|nr:MAG: hypothetical protein Ct9H300mP31_16510 [Acidimicrobiaceae bacterium]